ncbi:MAG TPA: glycosyltransferase family 2 protein [Pirellulales bacterium]|nr:glycosyltransferase family 2 protein [Pirellulales bacterium]
MQQTLAIVLWLSFGLVVYAYLGYPLLIWLCSRLFGRVELPPELSDGELPTITLLIAAHNEQAVIGQRLENALALDYPPERMAILVASDGSSDGTAEIVRSFAHRNVRLLDFQANRGKSAVLNAAWSELASELVLLSDANTHIEPAAPRRLVRWFRSPDVGAVCGRLILVDPATGKNVDSLYWRYETFLKRCEGRLGALLGANGAIYAIRRETFVPIPTETIVDDFVIPLLARLKRGCRLVYDAEAVAYEETPARIGDEFRRRVRIGAGAFQSLGLLWPLLSPRYGWLAFSFFSHKLLRWLAPFCLVAMILANLPLGFQPFYRATLLAQATFYGLALIGARLPGKRGAVRLLRLATLFSSMNLALLGGFFRWLSGRQRGAWVRTER